MKSDHCKDLIAATIAGQLLKSDSPLAHQAGKPVSKGHNHHCWMTDSPNNGLGRGQSPYVICVRIGAYWSVLVCKYSMSGLGVYVLRGVVFTGKSGPVSNRNRPQQHCDPKCLDILLELWHQIGWITRKHAEDQTVFVIWTFHSLFVKLIFSKWFTSNWDRRRCSSRVPTLIPTTEILHRPTLKEFYFCMASDYRLVFQIIASIFMFTKWHENKYT